VSKLSEINGFWYNLIVPLSGLDANVSGILLLTDVSHSFHKVHNKDEAFVMEVAHDEEILLWDLPSEYRPTSAWLRTRQMNNTYKLLIVVFT